MPAAMPDLPALVLMWIAMMAAMMLPGAVPWIAAQGTPFAAGYLAVWTIFGAGAAVVQSGLDRIGALSGAMALHGALVAALVVAAVGVYELTPLKNACLHHCRPDDRARNAELGAGMRTNLAAGIRQGLYCLGCCWALMALLFVAGVMNVVAMLALTAFIVVEKLLPARVPVARIAGVALIAAAAVLGWRAGTGT
jgi:predicted metal-binding membrane protein